LVEGYIVPTLFRMANNLLPVVYMKFTRVQITFELS
jgi:hypothetical protein